jgi:hypothetical protein
MHGRVKIVTVTNGGYGGPNESHFHTLTAAGKGSLETLFAVAEVTCAVRRHMLRQLRLELPKLGRDRLHRCIAGFLNRIQMPACRWP